MFIGRVAELQQLAIFFNRSIAGLAVCCGRRRIGKSTLIEYAAKGYKFVEFYGLSPREGSSNKEQLSHFSKLLAKQFYIATPTFSDWQDALDMLAALTRQGPYIIFLDEISWMVGKDKDFPGKLKGVWDTQLKKNPDLRLILCGSVSSWIQKNILKNKGFVGRVSLTIELEELPLDEANQFWRGNNFISAYEKFKVLCVTGGVPRYLEEIDSKLTAEQNIKHLCFTKGGVLLDEFDKIFSDLFGKQAEHYQEIIKALSGHPKSYDEICNYFKVKPSGNLNEKLKVLTECGFLTRDHVWKGKIRSKKLSKYRLKDNYLRFYLKYIEDKKTVIENGLYHDVDMENFSDWSSIMGLQFENLVLNNLPTLQKILQIAPESILSAAPYFQNSTKRLSGCQIDLLIQTKFTYYLCEIKFKQQIGRDIIDDVIQKIARLKIPKTISVRPVLIYQAELSKQVISENFFSHYISFDDLLMVEKSTNQS
jgi:AAA+ ATPase superfamily predicted ATPase